MTTKKNKITKTIITIKGQRRTKTVDTSDNPSADNGRSMRRRQTIETARTGVRSQAVRGHAGRRRRAPSGGEAVGGLSPSHSPPRATDLLGCAARKVERLN